MKKGKNLTLGIFGNSTKEEVSDLLREIVDYLKKLKVDFLVDRELAESVAYRDKGHSASIKKNPVGRRFHSFTRRRRNIS